MRTTAPEDLPQDGWVNQGRVGPQGELVAKESPSAAREVGAWLSEDRTYRFRLWRGAAPRLGWIMLNPSTADAWSNDATIRKCWGFATRLGFTGIDVVNLYAYRTRSPSVLVTLDYDVAFGPPQQLKALHQFFEENRWIMAGWGTNQMIYYRKLARSGGRGPWTPKMIRGMATNWGRDLGCLGVNIDGTPKHPLMLSYKLPVIPYERHYDERMA